MRKRLVAAIFGSWLALAGVAKADSIAIGQLSYLGTTLNGASVFKVTLNPPSGISLAGLVPSLYIGNDKLTFVLPTGNEFLFLTGPGTAFANCPCTDAHLDFFANPGTTISFLGDTLTLKRLSHSFLRPPIGATFLIPQQSATIYLSTVPGQTEAANRVTAVPEPATWALTAAGLGIILLKSRRMLLS